MLEANKWKIKKPTRSEIFLYICISFIIGILIGSYISIEMYFLLFCSGLSLSLVFLFRKNRKFTAVFLGIVFLLLGFFRMELEKLESEKIGISLIENQTMHLKGVVYSMPELKGARQKIFLGSLYNKENRKKIDGKIIVYSKRYPEYQEGDEIEIIGQIKSPKNFDNFDYKDYLAAKNIYYIFYHPRIRLLEKEKSKSIFSEITKLRIKANDIIKEVFPQPQAGVVGAMTLAVKSNVEKNIIESFNKTGTRHIIAISGLHIACVLFILSYIMLDVAGLKRNIVFYFSVFGILFFLGLSGFQISAIRAVIMGIAALLAVKTGRLKNSTNAISFAALLMLLYDPDLLIKNIGFQLSFAAVLGIVYVYPRLDEIFEKYKNHFAVKTTFLITISAQIATFPIIVVNFGSFPLLSVFANVLILPFVPIVLLLSPIIIALGAVSLPAAKILSLPISLILLYQIETIKFISKIPYSFLDFDFGNFESAFLIVYYTALFLLLKKEQFLKKLISEKI